MNSISNIKAMIILDLNGKRVLSNYYDADLQNAKRLERQLFVRTRNIKTKDDILLMENSLVIHRLMSEYHIYVIGHRDENPLLLERTLNCLVEVASTLMNNNIESKSFHDNLKQIILAFDEMCEQGTLLEVDPNLVLDRVCLETGVAEQSLAQVLQNATDLRFSWLRS